MSKHYNTLKLTIPEFIWLKANTMRQYKRISTGSDKFGNTTKAKLQANSKRVKALERLAKKFEKLTDEDATKIHGEPHIDVPVNRVQARFIQDLCKIIQKTLTEKVIPEYNRRLKEAKEPNIKERHKKYLEGAKGVLDAIKSLQKKVERTL